MIDFLTATLLCTGTAPTVPRTNIEVEVRPGTFSTIRYEYAEGPYAGTAYIQSIGHLTARKVPESVSFATGTGKLRTELILRIDSDVIASASFTHLPSGSKKNPLECMLEE